MNRKEILEKDYKMPNINDNTIKNIKKRSRLYRGHVRTLMGKIYKTDEFERKKTSISLKMLP